MIEDLVFKRTLAEVVLERILYVRPTMTIAEAATRLAEGYGALILTEPLGAVTETDIVHAIANGIGVDQPVAYVAKRRLFLIGQDETLESGLRVLLDHPTWCVIVIDAAHDGIGRLTVAEVVKTLSSCPPWLHALELALEPDEATLIAVELWTALRVLVTEDEPHAADQAADDLTAAGHEVVRCVEATKQAFPCIGLRDLGSCPLRDGVVDVTLAVRHMASAAPSRREDGVLCSIRHHVPVVVAGDLLFDPFETWEGTAIGARDDVVEACVRGANGPLAAHSEIARQAAWEVVRLHSRDISVLEAVHRMETVDASVRRVGGRLFVEVVAEVDPAVEPMLAVRVTVALRAFDKDARAIDVSVRRPEPEDQAY